MCESVHVSMCTRRLGTVYSERRVCECACENVYKEARYSVQ